MEKAIVEIFENFTDWKKLSQQCDSLGELTSIEKDKAKSAFLFLENELGENFLKDVLNNGFHPIYWYITNQAPWTRRWITYFAEMLNEVRNKKGYDSLFNRIKNKNQFSEGFSVLENAYKFSKAGLDVSFDPEIQVYDKIKKPDLKLINRSNQEELFVEISYLYESVQAKEIEETSRPILMCLMKFHSISFSVRIYKIISKIHLNDIVNELEKKIEKSLKENIFQELIEENIIEIGIAPKIKEPLLENWAIQRGLKIGDIIGPPYNNDEVFRIKQKIANEQQQLPQNYLNILIIGNNQFQFIPDFDYEYMRNELEETIYKYPQLLFVVIANEYTIMGECEYKSFMGDDYIYIKRHKPDIFLAEQYLVLINKYCNKKEKIDYALSLSKSFLNLY
ncbi:MAG: hypothetical protein ACYDDB_08440 [bacterium]